MTFYNHIENVRTMAINLTHGEPWHGARDKARVFDSLDAARREYMQLQAENAKLRELVRDLVTTVRGCGQDEDGYGQLPCEEVCHHWSNDGECTRLHRDQCWYEEQARELGIEAE